MPLAALPVFARSSATICVGLIGSGIQASLTPAMHVREGAAHGLTYEYRLIDLDTLGLPASALPDLIGAAEQAGFAGLNITFPCKQTVLAHLHDLSEDARALGAVNTVVLRQGRRTGHNTDWWGFAEGFKRDLGHVPKTRVVQLGAGGAGSAVAHALMTLGVAHLDIVDTVHAKAETLAAALTARFPAASITAHRAPDDVARSADGIVNATPVGMAKYPGLPFDACLLRPDLWIADIIYFPLVTELIHRARALAVPTMTGGRMAVYQAVRAFELFSGRTGDAQRMERHFAELAATMGT
jgi:shikimate dehydrogenase